LLRLRQHAAWAISPRFLPWSAAGGQAALAWLQPSRRLACRIPISRLQFARDEIDRVFGAGYAGAHLDAVSAVMMTAASDYLTFNIARFR
jgi:hypothetical protein